MEIIYGKNPIKEAIAAESRKFFEIMISRENADDITSLVRKIPVHTLSKQELDRISKTRFHQGIVAKVSRYRYANLNSLFDLPVVVLLDSVEDPQNLGAIIRSAYALAEAGIIIPENRAAGITPAVVKASAGATEHAKIARVTNLRMAAKELKKAGYWIVGLDAGSTVPLREIPSYDKTALLLGGEDAGIRTGMEKEVDVLAHIPMKGIFNSLNVSNSAAIGMYELISRPHR
ncbi:MAG TPA: 23S rRNA (guanosine(2251)-2'-O)-methyltransferase RlmB [Deltaproteobacteria bacterium]|mgnify:CR=1 FL=1|nr:23S rRNA (guanosine(2251)-2'-O)-methyltransferase RlmB [Deltaproteobacteria bacterium]